MAENDQEKTEQASSRRKEQARQEGNFAISKELSTFFMILAGLMILYFSGLWMAMGVAELMKKSFHIVRSELTVKDVSDLFGTISYKFFLIIAPILAIPVFGAISYAIQSGFAFTGKPLTPDISKIDPLSGFKKLFSLNSIAELVKSLLKVSILTYVVYVNVAKEWNSLPFLMNMEVAGSAAYMGKVTITIMSKTLWVLALIAVIDYGYQKWNYEKGLRMSKEELKEEHKEMEGDPAVKARIKSIQREMARKRMMQDVPTADVVVTNPTHLAVAIKYDRSKGNAPIVVAKGAGYIAQKIRELAKNSKVPVIENKPLARSLFKHVEVGKEIPVTLYKAVAEILAYVYKLKSKRH